MKNDIAKFAGLHAVGTALYIVAVALFLNNVPQFLRSLPNEILIGAAMLLLFVFSAAFTGTMILGRPVLWYLEGKKKEAVSLLLTTLAMLFLITLLAFVALALWSESLPANASFPLN